MADMSNISVHRYGEDVGYIGWIEPNDRSWIVFVNDDGKPELFGRRDADGGVIDDKPVTV
jgi:hypothetical protein